MRPGSRAGQEGQATVELALVIPVLLLMTALVFQVALAVSCFMAVDGCSREGARRAAETNDAGAAKRAAMRSAGGLPGKDPSVDVGFPEGRAKGSPVTVTVTYRVPLLLPGLDRLVPRPVFKRSTTMCLERAR